MSPLLSEIKGEVDPAGKVVWDDGIAKESIEIPPVAPRNNFLI